MTVKASSVLYKEIMRIKELGEVDVNDAKAALKYAEEHGLNIAARAIQGNPNRYLKCINEGMEIGAF